MRILLISDNKIFGRGGGSFEEHKYYDGIRNYVLKNGGEFKTISIDAPFENGLDITVKKNKTIDVLVRVCLHSTYMYFTWVKNKKKIMDYKPNIVFLGRSRLGFVAKYIKSMYPQIKVICNMENIEQDYVVGYFADRGGLLRNLYVKHEMICVKRDEKNAVIYSDALDYLTNRDYNRAHSLYLIKDKIETILPICIEKSSELTINSECHNIVFIGSLNYGSNIDALTDFVKHVWIPKYNNRKDIRLIVGGSNPSDELKQTIQSLSNSILYENFGSLTDIIPIGSMVIAPIKKGAGMKVKVAEALSMGLSIIASDEALIGYEKAIEKDELNSIHRANTVDEYYKAIDSYLELDSSKKSDINWQNKNIYSVEYSYDVSRETIEKIINQTIK